MVFGLAHLHHFYEFRITHPHISLATAIANSVLQFSYTYLFGIYATFIFLRTGSLLAVVLIHTFCNTMGLPRVWGIVEPHWLFDRDAASVARSIRMWTVIYYVLLFGGLWAWCEAMYPWSESSMALTEF
jgi:prenyl protein peptidase